MEIIKIGVKNMTDKQIDLTAKILTGLIFLLLIIGIKYVVAIGILIVFLFFASLFVIAF